MAEQMIWLREEKVKNKIEFKYYFRMVLCKYWGIEGEVGERAVKGRLVLDVVESYERKTARRGVKIGISNRILLPTHQIWM